MLVVERQPSTEKSVQNNTTRPHIDLWSSIHMSTLTKVYIRRTVPLHSRNNALRCKENSVGLNQEKMKEATLFACLFAILINLQ